MVITGQSSRRGIANMRHRLDSHSVLFQTKTTPRENFFIAAGVQVGKAAGEFDFFTIHSDGTERTLALGLGAFRYVFVVHRQEPAYPGFFIFQVTSSHSVVAVVHYIVLQLAEDEMQHVVEMHADIRRNAARLLVVTLPGLQVPVSTGGDVSQVHFMLGVAFFRLHFVTQRNDRGMHTQLQDGVHLPASVFFDIDKAVYVPGVQYQRLFTDGIGARAQGEAHVAVVQVVGRADGDVIHSAAVIGAAQFVDMPVETLKLREKVRFREMTVDNANGIVLVHGGNEVVTSVFDRFHVARCDVTGSADQCELFAHRITLSISSNLFVTLRGN